MAKQIQLVHRRALLQGLDHAAEGIPISMNPQHQGALGFEGVGQGGEGPRGIVYNK
jgi:hypothetical protein